MVYLWIAMVIIFLAVEAATVSLVSIWFVGGSLVAMIAALLNASIPVQVILFFVVSLLLLVGVCPYFRKKQMGKKIATNADRILEMKAIVTEGIDEISGCGAVKVDGKIWSARTENGENLPEGTIVKVLRIEGVRAIVEKIN